MKKYYFSPSLYFFSPIKLRLNVYYTVTDTFLSVLRVRYKVMLCRALSWLSEFRFDWIIQLYNTRNIMNTTQYYLIRKLSSLDKNSRCFAMFRTHVTCTRVHSDIAASQCTWFGHFSWSQHYLWEASFEHVCRLSFSGSCFYHA